MKLTVKDHFIVNMLFNSGKLVEMNKYFLDIWKNYLENQLTGELIMGLKEDFCEGNETLKASLQKLMVRLGRLPHQQPNFVLLQVMRPDLTLMTFKKGNNRQMKISMPHFRIPSIYVKYPSKHANREPHLVSLPCSE